MSEALPAETFEGRLERYRLFDQVNGPYLRWQLEQFEGFLGRRVLEVGCGVGGIIEQLGRREYVLGIDVEEDVLQFTRRRFEGQAGRDFARLDIGAPTQADLALLKAGDFDTVVAVNVLEHIRDDRRALEVIAGALVPGGALALLVPAHPALYGNYDQLDGHFRRYTAAGLRERLEGAGLEVARLHHFNLVGGIGWWVQYRLLKRPGHAQGHLRTMDAMLPVLRRLESVVDPPFGLSLVAVGGKPD